ncbi:MAG: HAMP domain-containing histidine kinase, partial [Gammaproteobacteria bacterium]|nr:HAMP domain-containing histidine kinase [Gammaproteobacteria bacterium]
QMLDVNAWANRALLGLIMMLVLLGIMALVSAQAGQLGLAALGRVPGWQLWLYSALSLAVSAGLYAPLSRLVRRLVYPGNRLDEHRLKRWQQHLHMAASWEALAETARRLLGEALGQAVTVHLEDTDSPVVESGRRPDGPVLIATRQSGRWTCLPLDDADLAPGQRLTADVFASLLTAACNDLEYSLQRAQAERERLHEQHLVELGELSAAMAHELRNPLNIIAMAAASCDARTRSHIQTQISRADRLIGDLLTYSGQLQIRPQWVDLKHLVNALHTGDTAESLPLTCNIPEGLQVWADPQRLQQVLINLLDNARSFARTRQDGQIHIEAAPTGDGATWIRLHNNGPAIPAAQQPHLFQAFISKRPGGSGLGLAIVRRIMDAHGGQVAHRDDLGWPVTFEVRFPGVPSI